MLILNKTELQELTDKSNEALEYFRTRLKKMDYVTNLDYKHFAVLDDLVLELSVLQDKIRYLDAAYQKLKYKEKKNHEHLSKVKPSKSTVAIATT